MLTITDGWIKIRIQSQTEPVEVDFLIVVGGIAGLMAAIIIQQVAKISANPAMARKQTRFPLYHYRADFTETDDEKHCGRIVVRRGLDEKPTMRFNPLSYVLLLLAVCTTGSGRCERVRAGRRCADAKKLCRKNCLD